VVQSPHPLLLLLFSVCLHLSLGPKTFSLGLTGQPLLQSLQFLMALGPLFRGFDAPDVVVVFVISTHNVVAPAEGSREIVHKGHVVEIVVIGTGPEREDVLERPREIVSAVSVDGLEETEGDPDVHGEDVEVASAEDVENRTSDRCSTKDEDFSWMGVLSGEAEGSRVFVVNLVDVFVHGTPVEELMTEEVAHVFVDEEKRDLKGYILPSRERHLPGAHSETLSNWVKQPNQGELDGKVGKEDTLCAFPLILGRRDLVWLELPPTKVRNGVDDDPRDATSEVDNLMEEETSKASSEDWVTEQKVPVNPLSLDPVE